MMAPIVFAVLYLSFIVILIIINIFSIVKQNSRLKREVIFKFIDRFIVLSSIMIILVSLLWDFNYLRYKSAIPYSAWQTITINDFRGLKKPYTTLDGESQFAFISTNIKVRKNKSGIEIQSFFHPCRSYVFNRKLYSGDLLTHELYHLHITEYCARRMRKEIKDLSEFDKIGNIKELTNNMLIEEQILQVKYDDETYHGYVFSKQVEWQNKIDSSLISLRNYSKTIIPLKK